jgi:hypothetical protein
MSAAAIMAQEAGGAAIWQEGKAERCSRAGLREMGNDDKPEDLDLCFTAHFFGE